MFTEDLTVFFDTADFGDAATLTVSGVPSSVNVIFDRAYFEPLGQFESAQPMAWLAATDAGSAKQGDTLTVNSTTYTIVGVEPDGTGRVVMFRLRT